MDRWFAIFAQLENQNKNTQHYADEQCIIQVEHSVTPLRLSVCNDNADEYLLSISAAHLESLERIYADEFQQRQHSIDSIH